MKFLIRLLLSAMFCLTAEVAFFDFSFISLPIFIYPFRTAADIVEFYERLVSRGIAVSRLNSSRKKRNNFCSLLIREKMTVTQVLPHKKVVAAEQSSAQRDFIICSHIRGADKKSPHYNKELFRARGGVFSKTFSEIFQNPSLLPDKHGVKLLRFLKISQNFYVRTILRFPAERN